MILKANAAAKIDKINVLQIGVNAVFNIQINAHAKKSTPSN